MLGGMLQTVKDMLFPVFCLGCRKEGIWLCELCKATIDRCGVLLCPVCHEVQPYGMCCGACRPYSSIDGHVAGVVYEHRSLPARIIETFKYQYVTELVDTIHFLLEPVLEQHTAVLSHIDMIVPVPLHKKRYAERGFNQAMMIATMVGSHFDIPVVDCLERRMYTKQQATLEKEAREENVQRAFALREHSSILGTDLLLVDDVFTTGSTMQAAAGILRDAGASSVIGLSVARG